MTPGRPPCDGAVRRRSQGGFTLIELILTIGISSMIILPLLAWMILAFHSQEVVTTTSSESAGRNQLAVYLARDVGSASLVTVGGSDCVSSPAPAGPRPDVVVMSSTGGGATAPRVSYVLTAVDADSSRLVRRTCDTAGTMTDEQQLVERTAIANGSVTATCSSTPARPGDACARVAVTVAMADGNRIEATAIRHIGGSA